MKEYGMFWKNYVNFTGKSTRKEFWIARLVNFAVVLFIILMWIFYVYTTLMSVNKVYGLKTALMISMLLNTWLPNFWTVVTIIPTWAVSIRRFRDAGIGWYWVVPIKISELVLARYLGYPNAGILLAIVAIIEIILMCRPSKTVVSEAGDNEEKE
ncbi:DUF805 domain-containing protein [Lactobacillus sp. YT155]|uniref:DUF805 domain-containing protein n=1 Tax=Lactobacillus sp. YT155 TaxID=3060955 RepID=UPI0026603A96|nr:DUF805 domain-containing protein [Lactobacillus sp. YT155]MDO1604746.1 DUF805 domain-containing protein [Lactobacillus sp. YT155]